MRKKLYNGSSIKSMQVLLAGSAIAEVECTTYRIRTARSIAQTHKAFNDNQAKADAQANAVRRDMDETLAHLKEHLPRNKYIYAAQQVEEEAAKELDAIRATQNREHMEILLQIKPQHGIVSEVTARIIEGADSVAKKWPPF